MSQALTVARPYAKAIFQLAKDSGQYKKWAALLQVLAIMVQDSQVIALIKAPMVAKVDKVEFIITVMPELFDAEGKNLIVTLVEQERLLLVPEIYALYEQYYAEEQQTITVDVCSATPLDQTQKDMFVIAISKYFKKNVVLQWRADLSLIGGVVVRSGDKVFDGSLRGKLQLLHKELISH